MPPHTMDSFRNMGGDVDVVDSAISRALRHVRKMHSFDRRIKIAHQHQNPDVGTDVPSYMRQTCASLIKRSSSRPRDICWSDLKPSRSKESKKEKKTDDKKRSESTDETLQQRRNSASDALDRKPMHQMSSPNELSMVLESSDNDSTPRSPDRTLSIEGSEEVKKLEGRDVDMSSPEDPCCAYALQNARSAERVASWRTMDDGGKGRTRGPSICSSMTLEDAHSEIAHDDSFCQVYESDDDDRNKSTPKAENIFTTSLFYRTCTYPQSPLATHSAQLDSGDSDNTIRVLHESQWSDDDSEDRDDDDCCKGFRKVESHRLNDILASFTESELGDDFSQMLMAAAENAEPLSEQEDKDMASSSSSNSPQIDTPFNATCCEKEAENEKPEISALNKCRLSKVDSGKLAKADGSYQIRGPGLLWMLGGNVIAGVVGAAIAAAGIPLATSQSAPGIIEEDVASLNSDGAHADDWFFQASSRVSMDT